MYDRAVDIEVDDPAGALIERRLDGTTISYPLIAPDVDGTFARLPLWDDSVVIVGRVEADLVVLTRRNRAIVLVLPDPDLAGESGTPGFAVTLPDTGQPVRLFAISGARAAEIIP